MTDASKVTNFGLTSFFVFMTFLVVLYYEKYFGKNDAVAVIAILVLATLIYSFYLSFSLTNVILFSLSLLFIWITFTFANSVIRKNKIK